MITPGCAAGPGLGGTQRVGTAVMGNAPSAPLVTAAIARSRRLVSSSMRRRMACRFGSA